MKKMSILALVGALVVAMSAGTAVAKPDKAKGPKKPKTVTYVFHGTVETVTLGTDSPTGETVGSGSVTVDVKKGNKAARTFAKSNGTSQTFEVDSDGIDSDTKFEVNGEDATLADVQVGDEVKVQVKAPASDTSLTARQLQVEDESAEDSAPAT
jgi:hypothetical protein